MLINHCKPQKCHHNHYTYFSNKVIIIRQELKLKTMFLQFLHFGVIHYCLTDLKNRTASQHQNINFLELTGNEFLN